MAETSRLLIAQNNRTDEALTSRDDDDELIVREKATRDKYRETVTLTIDGLQVTVAKAVPATDFLGNVIHEADGDTKPRSTTIYDAARQLVAEGRWTEADLAKRIPLLCHREHLDPIAVCRMCSVHVCKFKKSQNRVAENNVLVPACQHEVQERMEVTTRGGENPGNKDSKRFASTVERSVKLLTELLLADHRHPDPVRDDRFVNELQTVANELSVSGPRARIKPNEGRNVPHGAKARPLPLETVDELPYSSRTILVDHDRCILCDRCVRSCSDVKPFKVIGHTGKGYGTRISFDLDLVQNDSSCVQCGECMTSCPTGALTLKRRVAPKAFTDAAPIPEDPTAALPAGFLSANQMKDISLEYYDLDELPNCKLTPEEAKGLSVDAYYEATEKLKEERCRKVFKPFDEIPYSYLRWNEGAVRRRSVKKGDYLCRQGEYASTAFFLESGRYAILEEKPAAKKGGLFGSAKPTSNYITDIGKEALIFGELACLNNLARTRSVQAIEDGVVYEVTRNILDMARRSPTARYFINTIYRKNALRICVQDVKLFEPLNAQDRLLAASILNEPGAAEFKQVEPGEAIVKEGDPAKDFYMIFRGFVKFEQLVNGVPKVVSHMGKGDSFGELALLAKHPEIALYWKGDRDRPVRTVSAVALDPVEVIRVPGEKFRDLCEQIPSILPPLVKKAKGHQQGVRAPRLETDHLADYLDQGLYQGQSLLVLDLASCTRCDECTRACADSHGGTSRMAPSVSRLLREGQRFGDFLVATSCRSCHKPYCMEGCPVDAINRSGTSKEIRINPNTCIGCSLCEQNCPYGAIQMVPKNLADLTKGLLAKGPRLAVDCDLCHTLVPEGADTFCVAACPHDAAHRVRGEELLEIVKSRS